MNEWECVRVVRYMNSWGGGREENKCLPLTLGKKERERMPPPGHGRWAMGVRAFGKRMRGDRQNDQTQVQNRHTETRPDTSAFPFQVPKSFLDPCASASTIPRSGLCRARACLRSYSAPFQVRSVLLLLFTSPRLNRNGLAAGYGPHKLCD